MSEPGGHNHEEAKKIKILKIGVWVISILLLTVWIISLRFSVGSNVPPKSEEEANSWQKEFSETIGFIRESLDDATEDNASSTEITEQGKEFIEDLKNDVENMKPTDEVASSSADALLDDLEKHLTASSTVSIPETITPKQFCPEYINCMPTIGEARPCTIPPGCENYTQIAY